VGNSRKNTEGGGSHRDVEKLGEKMKLEGGVGCRGDKKNSGKTDIPNNGDLSQDKAKGRVGVGKRMKHNSCNRRNREGTGRGVGKRERKTLSSQENTIPKSQNMPEIIKERILSIQIRWSGWRGGALHQGKGDTKRCMGL